MESWRSSSRIFLALSLCAWLAPVLINGALAAAVHGVHDHANPTGTSPQPSPARTKNDSKAAAASTKLPPLPAGVTELKFNDFFVKPVGPRGLELTEKLRSLDGQRVRILGHMAHRDVQPAGTFLLTPFPVAIHDHDNSLAEDMPASVVQVEVPHLKDQAIPFAPGLMLLTGTLSLGNRAEPDGRVSLVRLELDPPGKYRPAGAFTNRRTAKGAEALRRISGARPPSGRATAVGAH